MPGSDTALGRAREWLLLDGDRLVVTAVLSLAILALAYLVAPLVPITDSRITPLYYAFSALLSGNLNLLTIVLSINQLVFTRELASPGKFREQVAGIEELREDVAASTGEESPPIAPAEFVRVILESIAESASDLRTIASDHRDPAVRDDAAEIADALAADVRRTRDVLGEGQVPSAEVTRALIPFEFTRHYQRVSRLRTRHGEALGEAAGADLDRLARLLEQLAVAREHFKQLYTRETLSDMSRKLLYVGVPTEVVLTLTLARFLGLLGPAPDAFSPLVVYAVLAVGLAPLALVFSYVLQGATVAHRTATTTQFTTPSEEG